jgi:putative hydrolase of the HAD superfamily
VLVLPDPFVLGPLLVPYGGDPDPERHRRAHYEAMAAKSHAGAGETEWTHYDEVYVASIGVHPHERADAADALCHTRTPWVWQHPVPGSVEALAALASRDVPIGVVSNAAGQIEATLRRMSICQVGEGPATAVRCVVDSQVVGVAKPDPAIFSFALPAFPEVPVERIGYVGDSLTMDVAGARAAGLVPILIDPYDDHVGLDVHRIRGLADLLAG